MKKYLQITSVLLLSMVLKAQPNVSLWHVTDPAMHEQDHNKGASYIDCAGYIYGTVEEGINVYHFDILNEGSAPMTIVDVSLSSNSSPGFALQNAPKFIIVGPGEDVSFEVTYTKPNPYEPGKGFNITVVTDDPRKSYCSFSAEVGLNPIASYCVCNGDSVYTKDYAVDGFPEFNEFIIHSGNCDGMEICPDSSEVNCYFSRGGLVTDYNNIQCELGFSEIYNVYIEGYCPCQAEPANLCIMPSDVISTNCPDTLEYFVDVCMQEMNTSALINHKFKWVVAGFGKIAGSDSGSTVIVVDFLPGDVLYLFVSDTDDPEGCVDVLTSIIGQRVLLERLDVFRFDEELCANGNITICFEPNNPDVLRNVSNKRGENYLISTTDPDAEIGVPEDQEGRLCFEVSGLDIFEGIAVYCKDESNCLTAFGSYYQKACDKYCEIIVAENVEFGEDGSQISIDDPCNCGDPENVLNPNGSVLLFHDVLSVDVGIANSPVVITDLNGQIKQMDGTSFGIINTMTDANGFVYQDYWHSIGDQAIVAIGVGNLEYTYLTAVCSDPCLQIPTMGQWAVFILLTMLAITGVVFVRGHRLAPKHQ